MRTSLLVLVALSVACAPPAPTPPVDAGPADAGPLNGPSDAGADDDAGPHDAGAVDAGPDAGGLDAGAPLAWAPGITEPPTRSVHGLVYLPWVDRTLLFSGNHGPRPSADTWTFDGAAWARLDGGAAPCPERKNFGLAVDPDGGQAYVFAGVWSGYQTDGGYAVRTLADGCRFDGQAWLPWAISQGPSARAGHAMAFDERRRQLVVFGGMTDQQQVLDDTWLFDGASWRQATLTQPSPSGRLNAKLVYDAQRGRLVLFGGHRFAAPGSPLELLADTWEWDGAEWAPRATAHAPPARGFYAMTYDAKHARVLVLGGATQSPPVPAAAVLDDLWSFDGVDWAQVPWPTTGPRPRARSGAALAYDARRGVVRLFGGQGASDELNDGWELDGTSWVERTALPPPASERSFAVSATGPEAFQFGGYVTAGGLELSTAWRFDGTRWRRLAEPGPSARSDAPAALHGADALVFGGRTKTALLQDTWRHREGQGWSQLTGAGPPGRFQAAMAYDPVRARTVLFGGRGLAGRLGDTWEHDGTAWAQRAPTTSPPPRSGAALCWDSKAKMLVLVGGVSASNGILDDVWAYDGDTWRQRPVRSGLTARVMPAVACTPDGGLLSVGGYLPGSPIVVSTATERLEADGWKALPPLAPARFGASLLVTPSGFELLHGSTSDFQRAWDDFSETARLQAAPPQ